MPLLLSLPIAPPPEVQATHRQRFTGDLTITWHKQVVTLNSKVSRFTGGVTAVYGPSGTKIESDELDLHLDPTENWGEARGHVRLTDEAGVVLADKLSFSWLDKTGFAENVHITADSVRINAARLDISPAKWTIKDLYAAGYANGIRILQAKSGSGEIIPGKEILLKKPKFGMGPLLVGPFPDFHGSLRQKQVGVKFPTLSYHQGQGLGISWDSKLAVGSRSVLSGGYGNYPRSIPSYSFGVSTSFLPKDQLETAGEAQSALGDRFGTSYFQNALVSEPTDNWSSLRRPRKTFGISTYNNAGASGRDDFGRYLSPWDLVYEQAGSWKGVAFYGQARYQSIRRLNAPFQQRGLVWLAAAPPAVQVARNTSVFGRLDYSAFTQSGFSWARAEAGVAYQPVSFLRLGLGSFWGTESGNPEFQADVLDRSRGYSARADLLTGPTRFSYLVKWDPRVPGLYDREYSLHQAVGILDTFIEYRRAPSEFRYGFRLRLDQMLDSLKQRDPRRSDKRP